MFKQAFRLAFIAVVWKQYKQIIISTLLLFLYLFLVSNIHSDYLAHLQLQDRSQSSGASFVYKWLAYAIGVALYFCFHWWRAQPNTSEKNTRQSKRRKSIGKHTDNAQENDDPDPFEALRHKKNLRSRADFINGKE